MRSESDTVAIIVTYAGKPACIEFKEVVETMDYASFKVQKQLPGIRHLEGKIVAGIIPIPGHEVKIGCPHFRVKLTILTSKGDFTSNGKYTIGAT